MFKPLEYFFFLVSAAELFAEVTGNEVLQFFTKPALMIVLGWYYVQSVKGAMNKLHKLIIVAFFFSWIGDVTLMFVGTQGSLMGIPRNPNYFLVGLVGFLITHILYTVAFSDVTNKQVPALLPKKFWVAIPLLVYMGVLGAMLIPAINGNELTKPILVPVIVYSTAISVMVLFATNRYKRVNDRSFALVFGGAVLFMFSDSIIAISKFMHPFSASGISIMTLYIAGQYLIAKGCLAQFETNS